LLLEAPFDGVHESFHDAASELRDRGFGIVVGHPERSADAWLDGAAGLRDELALGAEAQVNALSLTGAYGPEAEAAAFELIGDGLVTIAALDAHGPTRPPALGLARCSLRGRGLDAATARDLT
jgi:protein-tyrosine phosphatase